MPSHWPDWTGAEPWFFRNLDLTPDEARERAPALGPRTGISCAGTATILERYYPPNYTTASGQSIYATVSGSIFTPE